MSFDRRHIQTGMRFAFLVAFAAIISRTTYGQTMENDHDCQQKYRDCLLVGEVALRCSCDFSACLRDDGAPAREWCVSASNAAITTIATGLVCTSARTYASVAECASTDGALSLPTPALDESRGCTEIIVVSIADSSDRSHWSSALYSSEPR